LTFQYADLILIRLYLIASDVNLIPITIIMLDLLIIDHWHILLFH